MGLIVKLSFIILLYIKLCGRKDTCNGEEMVKIATSDVVNYDGYCGVFDFANFEVDEEIDLDCVRGIVMNGNNQSLADVEIDLIEELE